MDWLADGKESESLGNGCGLLIGSVKKEMMAFPLDLQNMSSGKVFAAK